MSPNPWFFLRLVLFFTVAPGTLCWITYQVLQKRLHLSPKAKQVLKIGLGLLLFLLILGPTIFRALKPAPESFISTAFQTTQYILMGWVGVLFIALIFLEAAQLLARPFDPKKRIFLTEGLTKGVIAGVTLSSGLGFWEAQAGPEVRAVQFKLPGLPPEFNGLKITQISDVHIGPLLHSAFLERVVGQVMETRPDLIFITGDLVDGSVEQLSPMMESLKKLKAPDGVFFCTGNHEYYSGVEEWIHYLESIGIRVLKNSNQIIERPTARPSENTSKILVAGVYDYQADRMHSSHKADAFLAAHCAELVSVKLLLAHNPHCIDDAAKAGFDFQFSGHTHAGQFYPFAWIVKGLFKHTEGHYQINEKTQLYVNRGTGYWGPPNRLGNRSEITAYTFYGA